MEHGENTKQASQEDYIAIFNAANDGIFIIDIETSRIVDMNEKGCEMFCYPKEELLNLATFDLWANEPPYTREAGVELDSKASGGEPQLFEWLAKDKAGRQFWIEVNLKRAIIGGKYRLLAVVRDIAERKEAEEALRESEERYRLSADNMPIHLATIDKSGKFILWNKYSEKMFGYTNEEAVGKLRPVDLHEPKKEADEVIRVATEKGIYDKEINLRHKNGHLVQAHLVVVPRRDADGKIIGFYGFAEDITERRHAEEALREDERFMSNVFSSIQDGISILDKDMTIIRVNPTMENWYKHMMPLVGKKCYEAYHCKTKPCDVCPTAQTLSNGKAAYEVVPKVGANEKVVGWLDLFSFPLLDEATGRLKGVIEYVRDITERKLDEQELELLNKELIKSNKRMKQISLKDPQTGLYNHRYLTEVIEPEFYRARRYGHPLSLIMLDIDYFKSVNDVYGHKFGDLVLRQLATQLKKMVRRYDLVIRLGGEEFVVLSPGVDRTKAMLLAQRLLDAMDLYNFGDKERVIKLKFSIAVSSYPEETAGRGMDLINVAEKIIEKAKADGGNRVYSSLDLKRRKGAIFEERLETDDVRSLKEKIEKLTKQGKRNLVESIYAFAKTIELRDHYTGKHVESTVYYATGVARELDLPSEDIENIKEAAILHDLGKIGISDKILLKKRKLTKKEFEEIKRHPQIAADIIRPIQFMHDIIPLVLYHHERWDGKGYPAGLEGEEIPMGARIIAIADVYQALTSNRPYRKAFSKKEAIKIIKGGSGTQFDPKVVDTFLKVLKKENNKKG